MSATSRQNARDDASDRRCSRRYPLQAEVEYKVVQERKIAEIGRGRTLNLSSRGLLFEAAAEIPPGTQIELSIAWPAALNDSVRLRLYVMGRTVRRHGRMTAVRILSYEFRVRGRVETGSSSEG